MENTKLSPAGQTGWPDRIFWIPGGKPLLIEFKAPGGKPTRKQMYYHVMLCVLGYDIEVHDTVDGALAGISSAVSRAARSGCGKKS